MQETCLTCQRKKPIGHACDVCELPATSTLPQALEAIRERLEKATPGPWRMERDGRIKSLARTECQTFGTFSGIASTAKHAAEHAPNCELITHAPTDIAKLLRAVELLREQRDMLIRDGDPRTTYEQRVYDAELAKLFEEGE